MTSVRTSKILLIVWLALGAGLLAFTEVGPYELGFWGSGLAVLVWNRIDSRGKAYKFSVHAPGGVGASIEGPADEP